MGVTIIRFGIIDCADIARKVSRAIALAPNATLHAVGSRSLDKAQKFAAANGFPRHVKVYGSYEAVLDDPDVDAVYVPLPTSLHLHWAVLAAQKKKHLLLEKPVALNTGEFDKIVEACESNGVHCSSWMLHTCAAYRADLDFLRNDVRVKPDLDGLGALGDIGWYCIRGILFAANYALPKTVIALRQPVLNEAGVLLACGATLYWEDGKMATFHCSFLSNLAVDLTAVGTKGTLHVLDFIIPFQEREASFSAGSESSFDDLVTKWDPQPSRHTVNTDLPQEAHMVREFSRLVGRIKFNNGKPEKEWPTITRKTQLVLDAVKASIDGNFEPILIQE